MTEQKPLKPLDGGIAVGAYIRYLREAQGMQATEIAEKIGTDLTQIWRVEKWKSDTRSTLLFKLIYAVGGDASDVGMLINNPNATKSDGEALAKLRLELKRK
jgi:transcriptional regulator with XRE-family HTH domain